MTAELTVYVPTPGSSAERIIARGSAIVGERPQDGRIHVHYEGNVYGSESLARFAQRCLHAAGRYIERYPTVAQVWLEENELVAVGSWDEERGVAQLDADQSVWGRWLDCGVLDELDAYPERRETEAALAQIPDPRLRRQMAQRIPWMRDRA